MSEGTRSPEGDEYINHEQGLHGPRITNVEVKQRAEAEKLSRRKLMGKALAGAGVIVAGSFIKEGNPKLTQPVAETQVPQSTTPDVVRYPHITELPPVEMMDFSEIVVPGVDYINETDNNSDYSKGEPQVSFVKIKKNGQNDNPDLIYFREGKLPKTVFTTNPPSVPFEDIQKDNPDLVYMAVTCKGPTYPDGVAILDDSSGSSDLVGPWKKIVNFKKDETSSKYTLVFSDFNGAQVSLDESKSLSRLNAYDYDPTQPSDTQIV